MEERGIGRPSTYAPTIGVLLARNYVSKEQNALHPTELGITVSDLLTQFFANVMNLDFTAQMEEKLDEVSRGNGIGCRCCGSSTTPSPKTCFRLPKICPG